MPSTESNKSQSTIDEDIDLDQDEDDEELDFTNSFVWSINTPVNIEVLGDVFNFEYLGEYQIEDKYLKDEWFQSAITKGYLKAVS